MVGMANKTKVEIIRGNSYGIVDGDGKTLGSGLQWNNARATAQAVADEMGRPVYLYDASIPVDDDDENLGEEFRPVCSVTTRRPRECPVCADGACETKSEECGK